MKPIPAQTALDRGAPPWLFVTALVVSLPHAGHAPMWLISIAALIYAGAFHLWFNDRRLPGRWMLASVVVLASMGIWLEYRTLFGREPGVAWLVMLLALKMLELRSRRDAIVVLMLCYFMLLTHYLHDQGIPTALWLFVSLLQVTATLVRLHGGPPTLRENLLIGGRILLQALPLMLVLYVLFPRISGPLWGLPEDTRRARSGLSESMQPGEISDLVRSDEIAFRVRFIDPAPPRHTLYWRGPVFETFDGTRWSPTPAREGDDTARIEPLGPSLRYESTLEGHGQHWLLALDAPDQLPPGARLDGRLIARAATPVRERQRVAMRAWISYRFNRDESAARLTSNLRLPADSNPRSRELATRWRRENNAPEAIVEAALRHFRQEAFHYTLQPPLLGDQPVDDFLFRSRRGFCEHYASAFVVLMRAAGIPARVVTGYQGGDFNPVDGYLVVRQSEAHAWAEVWLPERGWVRIDPTAAVAPERIERGIAAALPAGEPLPRMLREPIDWLRDIRHRWEAINNAWNQSILGYDLQRQRELLSRLGWPDADWPQLAALLGGSILSLLAALLAWTLWQRPRPSPELRLWHRAQRRIGVDCAPEETPLAWLARLEKIDPERARMAQPVVDAFLSARYAPDHPDHLKALRAAVAQLPRWRMP